MPIINTLISAILQVVIFTLIAFIAFLFRKNKTEKFLQYIGLVKPTAKSIFIGLGIAALFVILGITLSLVNPEVKKLYHSDTAVTGQLYKMGVNSSSVPVLLITALIKTSLSEEILFRGFVAKRLIAKYGFKTGNLLQALFFGAIHFLLFYYRAKTGFVPCTFILVFSTAAAWLIGHNMMRNANGSIIPGWFSHGIGNTISYAVISFLL